MRAAASEEDWSAIRALLIESQARAGPGWNWDVRRWDGWRFHREQPLDDARLADRIAVWEGPGGRIVAAVHPEARGDAWLELDPGLRELEPEMVEWAETHLAEAPGPDRPARLDLWVRDDDERRARLLEGRGYQPQTDGGAWVRILALDGHPPAGADIDPAYRLRTTTPDDADAVRMAALLNAAFDTTVHTAREYRTFVERSPSFEHELNLVAEAPDGSFAAHVGLTHEPSNRHGIVEPVCTAPGHRRHGLARALLSEGSFAWLPAGCERSRSRPATMRPRTSSIDPAGSRTRTTSPGTAGRWPDRSPTVRAPARGPRETRSARPGGSARPPRGR